MAKILYIDQDPQAHKFLQMGIGQKHRIIHAMSGFEAFRMISTEKPDLIITDLDLPMMDGYEVMIRLRRTEALADIPILVLTDDKNVVTDEKCSLYGAVDVFSKPFIPSMLMNSITRILTAVDQKKSLTEQSQKDEMTGLWNKTYAGSLIDLQLKNHLGGALFVIDTVGFHNINEKFGRNAGDRTIMMFTDVIAKHAKEKDVIARLGGNSFLLFVSGLIDRTGMAALAGKLVDSLQEGLASYGYQSFASIAVGISIYGVDGEDFAALYDSADKAVSSIRCEGRNVYGFACDSKEDQERKENGLLSASNFNENLHIEQNKGQVMNLELREMATLCQYVLRQQSRVAVPVIFTLLPAQGGAAGDDECKTASVQLNRILQSTLSTEDAMTKYSGSQYLVLVSGQNTGYAYDIANKVAGNIVENYNTLGLPAFHLFYEVIQ